MVDDLVVVITGAAGRLGSAIAEGVLSNGGKVILIDVNKANLDKLEERLGSENALTIVADSGIPNEADHCIREGLQRFNRIDAAIHAAYPRSAGWGMRFENIQRDHLNEDLCTQLGGAILFPCMLKLFSRQEGQSDPYIVDHGGHAEVRKLFQHRDDLASRVYSD